MRLGSRTLGKRGRDAARALALSGLLMGFVLLAPAAAPAANPATLFKIATIAPEGSTWMKLMRELDERVRLETHGEVGFKFYPGGQQGSDLDVLRKIRAGQIQGAGLTGVGLGEIEPSLRILELPFLLNSVAEVALAHRVLDPVFEERLRARGFELLGWAEVGFVYLFSQDPVQSAEDLRGIRMWLWEGDPLAQALLEELGVSPVPLNITDVLTSLQTGIVNAVYATPYGCLSLQWFTRLRCMTDLKITYAIGAVVVSKPEFDRLTVSQREIVTRIANEVFAQLVAATHEQNDEAAEVIVERNVRRVEPAPGSRAGFALVGRRVWDRLAGRLYERELLDRLVTELEAARAGGAGSQP